MVNVSAIYETDTMTTKQWNNAYIDWLTLSVLEYQG